jgi:hypothetical protein
MARWPAALRAQVVWSGFEDAEEVEPEAVLERVLAAGPGPPGAVKRPSHFP